jgi:hypothetical protein
MAMIVLVVGGLGVITASVWWMVRLDRVNRQRIDRARAAWTAAGKAGEPSLDYLGGGGSGGGGG